MQQVWYRRLRKRSWEIIIPDPGFAGSNEPQFFRVVSTDASGQEGWDEAPVLVPTGNVTGTLTITTDLTGQTFNGGEPIPDMITISERERRATLFV